MVKHYDVVVLGGGPAGLAVAIALQLQRPCSILVADSGVDVRERAGESAPPDLLTSIRHLQLEDVFLADQHTKSPGNAVIWGRDQVGYNDHFMNPMGPPWRLNRARFDQMLKQAAQTSGIEIRWQTRYTGYKKSNSPAGGYHLYLIDLQSKKKYAVDAGWVVDASGPLARFAHDLGIHKRIDDQLFALAGYSRILNGNCRKQVLLESDAAGWWYAAWLPDDRIVQMYITDAATLRKMKSNQLQGWAAALKSTRLVGALPAGLELTEPLFHTFPVYSSLLEQITGDHWLAVGDAASCYDPIAAQGLYKALTDGVVAGRALADALAGQSEALSMYVSAVHARYNVYFDNRRQLYQQEQRWPAAAFWKKRWARGHPVIC